MKGLSAESRSMSATSPATEPKKTKLLLIDDDQLTRTTLRALLRNEGFTAVREAAEADTGMKMALHFQPDVICLDLHMPGKSGLELLGELKACLPDTPVVMITSTSDRTTVGACLAGGADGFIIKPFSAEKLVRTIEAVLGKRGTNLRAPLTGPC